MCIFKYICVYTCQALFFLRIPGYSFITTSLSSAVASGDGFCKNQLASHGKRAKCWTGCSWKFMKIHCPDIFEQAWRILQWKPSTRNHFRLETTTTKASVLCWWGIGVTSGKLLGENVAGILCSWGQRALAFVIIIPETATKLNHEMFCRGSLLIADMIWSLLTKTISHKNLLLTNKI